MKNKIFTFFLMITVSVAMAQVPRGFSVAAGVNQSIWDSKDLLADGGIGYSAGIGFNFGYHETYNYEFNVLYNQQSLNLYSIDYSNTNVSKVKAAMQTFSFSAQLNYYVIKPDEDKFYLGGLAGVNANFGMGDLSPEQSSEGGYLPYKINDFELTNASKVWVSPMVGLVAGYNKFRVAVKYNIGIANIIKNVQTGQINDNGLYTGPELEGKLSSASVILYYKVL